MNSFTSHNLLSINQKIECIDTWEFRGKKSLFLGTAEGYLLVYEVTENVSPQGNVTFSLNLKDTKTISKKPITQMNLFEHYNIIVILTDNEIRVYNLITWALISNLVKAKGCNVYATSYQPGISLSLAAAVKKKVITYMYDGMEFIESKEFNIPDVAKNIDYRLDSIVVCFKKSYVIIDTQTGQSINKDADKLSFITFIQDEEFLIVRSNMAFFIGLEGQPNRKFSLTWSDSPISMAIQYPFAISLEAKHVEIQIVPEVNSKPITQTLMLPGCKSITSKKDIYISSASTVWRLEPLPILELVDQLVSKHEYEIAIGLLSKQQNQDAQTPPGTITIREKTTQIKSSAAYYLFSKEQFGSAMEYFISAQVDPIKVVSLFPALLPQILQDKLSVPFHVREIEKNMQAIREFQLYLTSIRKELQAPKPPYNFQPPELLNSGYDLPTLIDTTLLKVYIKTNPNLISNLVNLKKHFCHIEESQRVLLEEKKIIELVYLYKSKGMHREALTLLAQYYPPNDTIQYLCSLGKQYISIILEHSRWVLQKCPKDALAIFTTERRDDPLPPDQIIQHLRTLAPTYLLDYLEYIINDPMYPDKTPEIHNDLVFEYLNSIRPLIESPMFPRVPGEIQAGQEPGLLGTLRTKLINFLQTSKFYQPEKMLSRFPNNDLFEERAILLSKIGRHEQALAIYAHRLKNFAMAEEYCDKHYNKDSEEARDVYLSLLNVYLKQQPLSGAPSSTSGPEQLIGPAMNLLYKHYRSINISKALQLLPTNIPIDQLYPFFESVIRDNTKTKRDNQIVKNLFKSEHYKIKEELIHLQSGIIKITDDLNCPVCGKKFLGTQAFAALPTGVAVHYVCFKQDIQRSTSNTNFK
ncbi:tetratricopeptide-like helical domain-containing protein (TPR) [Tieghemostelium lacteum]|uniref:Tetratricopeptide-like helical domain-containing protein (TPR) n=1 Tax=Tieghemostelium lacteum TaxID=361077 RepID=A0A151ZEG4_TIELA|nr:tetratricopeptide-like helical domain-containing protein (TPR) [Tieghemostelium lacteum]|eukprot:KYQ92348.1 tetratricopeptide-like helical domain-containing protein (TPR) [Tieghemostelium lacteum]